MSRSEQLHDASMEEILASIRKIITDDEPDQPSEDAFSANAIDEFREASAALARNRPSGGYMHDLTRALAGEAPAVAADDDIFDDSGPEPDSVLPESSLEDEPDAAPVSFVPPPSDDEDLFETEPEPAPVVEATAEPLAAASEEDEEIIEDLGDPIMLGPEIEFVEDEQDAPVAAAPGVSEVAAEAAALEPDIAASVVEEPAAPISVAAASEPVIETPITAAPPPPPPPPVVSAIVEKAAASVADVATEAVADVPEAQTETIAEAAAEVVTETSVLDASPIAEAAAEAIAETAVEAAVGPEIPAIEAVAESAAEAVTEIAMESVAQSLEAKAAALVEEFAAPVPEVAAAAEVPVPETVDAAPAAESAPEVNQPSQPAAGPSLVPDDMMAAMLKPMLKDWLDANMPRIVAKAMGGKDESAAP